MYVSRETPDETRARLLRVMAAADLRVFDEPYAYTEYPAATFPAARAGAAGAAGALAFVRDESVWSVLAPAEAGAADALRVFSFHFQPGLDNSGFVGWLATHLKQALGTGVIVVCGHNAARGGVFDYWAVPAAVADDVLAEVHRLRAAGNAPGV